MWPIFLFPLWILMQPMTLWGEETRQPVLPHLTDEEVAEIAQQRSYPGGSLEDDLQVQKNFPTPYSQFNVKETREQIRKELSEETASPPNNTDKKEE